MEIGAVIDILRAPLALRGDAMMYPLSGGAINHSYYLHDDSNEYMVKHFQSEDSLGIDRQERFDLQLQLSKKRLAPKPIYLSAEHGIYVEQWIKQHRSQLLLFFDELHINALAAALTRIHQSNVKAKSVDLPNEWQRYLLSLPDPSSFLIEQVTTLTEQWIECNENYPADVVFCHNDLAWAHLCGPTKIVLDWEYAGLGNRYFDLLSCAKVNGFKSKQHDELFNAYSKLNEIPINDVYEGCQRQANFIELTYQLWYQAIGISP